MSSVATIAVGATVASAYVQKESAKDAARAQERSAQQGINEQQRQFEAIQELLAPYVEAGAGAVSAQGNLIGLGGADAQRSAIQALQDSPEFKYLVQSGEEAILQNAAATGGLRGGNVQASLARYRPQVLGQLIEQQFGRLGQISSLGQASAAGEAAAGQNASNAITSLLTQQGQARAGAELARGQAISNVIGSLGQLGIASQGGAF